MNYNQPLSVVHSGRYIYSKEVHTLTREIELKLVKDYDFRFFIRDSKSIGPYTDVKGNPLKQIKAKSIIDFKAKVKAFKDYGHPCFGTNRLGYQYLYEEFDKTKYNNKMVRIAFFDIETARDPMTGYSKANEAKNPVTTISLVMNGKIYYWARKDLPANFIENSGLDKEHYTGFEFFWFQTEAEMLNHFNRFVGLNVDVLSGWHIEGYDIPYVVQRSYNLNIKPKHLSPFGIINKREFNDKYGKPVIAWDIMGVEVLDYLVLYKKFTYVTLENYKLDTVAYVELKDKKIDYTEHKNLDELYEKDFNKFSIYNIKDSLICHRLEEKMKLIDLAMTLAYKTGVNFEDTLGTVKMWTFYFYQEMMNKKIAPPMHKESRPLKEIVGGYVKEPIRGMHKWVVSVDLASLYPHNQMGMNISFDKLLDEIELPNEIKELKRSIWADSDSVEECIENIVNKEYDLDVLKQFNIGMTPNIQFYKNDSLGIIPIILKGVYNERKAVKKEMLQRKQELVDIKEKYKHWEV